MREGGLRYSVMLCGRGLRTTHMHRPITTYFLGAKIRSIFESSKYFGTFFVARRFFLLSSSLFPNLFVYIISQYRTAWTSIRGLHDSVLIDTLIAKGIDVSAIYDGASISFKRKITLNGDKTKIMLA